MLQQIPELLSDQLQPHSFTVHVLHSATVSVTGLAIRLQMVQPVEQHNQAPAVPSAFDVFDFEWVVEGPKGQYPEGSRYLKGQDKNYIISPLGTIVDEKYTAYFDFQSSSW